MFLLQKGSCTMRYDGCKIARYAWADTLNWLKDFRFWTGVCVLTAFLHMNTSEIVTYASSFQLKFTPWFFPFVVSTRIVRLFLYLILFFLICDVGAPKAIDRLVQLRLTPMEIRSGKLLILLIRVLIFWTLVAVLPVILFFTHLEWSFRWGKIWGNLARVADYEALGEYAIRVSRKIVDGYDPLPALLISLFLCVGSGYLLGAVILLLGRAGKQTLGLLGAGTFVLIDFWIETDVMALDALLKISFCTYSNLRYHSGEAQWSSITTPWAFFMTLVLAVGISLLYLCPFRLPGLKKGDSHGTDP